MTDDNTVCVASFGNEFAAETARIKLEANGIDCFIAKDDCGGMRPHLQLSTGVRLIVKESDAERAAELLSQSDSEDPAPTSKP